MLPRDKVSKAAWSLTTASTDAVDVALGLAVKEGKLKLDNEQFSFLRNTIKSAIESGYHRAHKNFMQTIDGVVNDINESALADALAKVSEPGNLTKKKRGDKASGDS